MTKIGIEIYKPFVYNVRIAASNPKPQDWKAGPSRKENEDNHVHCKFYS